MALSINVSDNCKYLTVIINYTTASSVTVSLDIVDYNGISISGSLNPTFTISSGSAPINYPIPIDDLDITNGIITVVLNSSSGNEIAKASALVHCDIDCCLTKLTNELLECDCDCLKCSSALAKAQKVFLLIKSADHALSQINILNPSNTAGYLKDAQNKYLKSKEICDDSCGCDC